MKFEIFPDMLIQRICVANSLQLDDGAVMESTSHCYEEEVSFFYGR